MIGARRQAELLHGLLEQQGALAVGQAMPLDFVGRELRVGFALARQLSVAGDDDALTHGRRGFAISARAKFGQHYLSAEDDLNDPKASPLKAGPLRGLAPAHIITAGFDPLRDEGEAYAAKLKADGVEVTLRRHSSLIHGFLNFSIANRTSHDAVCEMAGVLRAALAA